MAPFPALFQPKRDAATQAARRWSTAAGWRMAQECGLGEHTARGSPNLSTNVDEPADVYMPQLLTLLARIRPAAGYWATVSVPRRPGRFRPRLRGEAAATVEPIIGADSHEHWAGEVDVTGRYRTLGAFSAAARSSCRRRGRAGRPRRGARGTKPGRAGPRPFRLGPAGWRAVTREVAAPRPGID